MFIIRKSTIQLPLCDEENSILVTIWSCHVKIKVLYNYYNIKVFI